MIRLLSPYTMMALCWSVTATVATLTLSHLHLFDLVPLFMEREDLQLSAFTQLGAAWLVLAFLAYTLGDMATRYALSSGPVTLRPSPVLNLGLMARLTCHINLILLGVTLFWITHTAFGAGPARFAQLLLDNTQQARALLLENKLFVGMRLFYATLPATGCLAIAILATGRGQLSRPTRARCLITVTLNTAALLLLPIVMSQRLLLFQYLLSAYVVTCLIRGRIVGLPYLTLGALAFFATWVAREALTNPTIDHAALDIGVQKLTYYFVNDLWNAFAPLQREIPHSFGMYTLSGLMFFTFTDGLFQAELANRLQELEHVLGGGTFPFLTAVFVDFGMVGGVMAIIVCGVLFRLCFHLAQVSLGWKVAYAQLAAALLFSSHSLYFTHQNFLFSLIVLGVIIRLSNPRKIRNLNRTGSKATPTPAFTSIRNTRRPDP